MLTWLRRLIMKREQEPIVATEPFITTICPDCGARIEWQEQIVAGSGVEVVCTCQAHWVAVAPAVSIMREKEFMKAYGLGHSSMLLEE